MFFRLNTFQSPGAMQMLMVMLPVLLITALLTTLGDARTVSLSNVALPLDQNGELLLTGESSVLQHDGAFYVYFNNWGGCAGSTTGPIGP